MYNIILTRDQKTYIEGLLEQEYNGLKKSETYNGEFKEETDICDMLLKSFGKVFENNG